MSSKRILVTGVSSDAGLGVIRQLVESGYQVVGADWRTLPLGLRSRFLEAVHRLPELTDDGFATSLVNLVGNLRPDAFLPLGTKTVAVACQHARCLGEVTSCLAPDVSAYQAASDKAFCNQECCKLGIPCPVTYTVDEAAASLVRGNTVVVKPATDVGMASGLHYVNSRQALQQRLRSCLRRYGSCTLQEYIPGDVSHMHTVVLLFDRSSNLVASFTTQKIRQWPSGGGTTAVSRSTDAYHLVEQCLPFFRKWRWKGAAEVELKYDPRDGKYKVIEINPRFPAYLRFAMCCGLPLARLAAQLALGGEIAALKYPSYAVGMKYVNPGLFLRSALADLKTARSKAGAVTKAVSDLTGTGRVFAHMLGDPLPVVGRMLADLGQLWGG